MSGKTVLCFKMILVKTRRCSSPDTFGHFLSSSSCPCMPISMKITRYWTGNQYFQQHALSSQVDIDQADCLEKVAWELSSTLLLFPITYLSAPSSLCIFETTNICVNGQYEGHPNSTQWISCYLSISELCCISCVLPALVPLQLVDTISSVVNRRQCISIGFNWCSNTNQKNVHRCWNSVLADTWNTTQ